MKHKPTKHPNTGIPSNLPNFQIENHDIVSVKYFNIEDIENIEEFGVEANEEIWVYDSNKEWFQIEYGDELPQHVILVTKRKSVTKTLTEKLATLPPYPKKEGYDINCLGYGFEHINGAIDFAVYVQDVGWLSGRSKQSAGLGFYIEYLKNWETLERERLQRITDKVVELKENISFAHSEIDKIQSVCKHSEVDLREVGYEGYDYKYYQIEGRCLICKKNIRITEDDPQYITYRKKLI